MTRPRLDTLLGSFTGDLALAMFEHHDLAHAHARRNARRKHPDRALATLAALAAQAHAETSTRQGDARRVARTKLARFIAQHSGARVEGTPTFDREGNVVVSGSVGEMRKVAAWVEWLAREAKHPVSAVVETYDDPDDPDPDWAVCRIRGLDDA